MRIAVASEGNMVTGHFGHCEKFWVFTTDDDNIAGQVSLKNPGHKPGFLPNYLHDQGVNVIISGGMGGGAIDIFNSHNIEVIVGASGEAKMNAENYMRGELKSTGSVCHQHAHADDCGGH